MLRVLVMGLIPKARNFSASSMNVGVLVLFWCCFVIFCFVCFVSFFVLFCYITCVSDRIDGTMHSHFQCRQETVCACVY